jgi:hypothetical protein
VIRVTICIAACHGRSARAGAASVGASARGDIGEVAAWWHEVRSEARPEKAEDGRRKRRAGAHNALTRAIPRRRLNGSRDAPNIKLQNERALMDEIERLELRIEELTEAIGRSRRLRLAGQVSAVIGPMLLAGLALGLVSYTPPRMIVALALAIGGVVLMGSSRSSTEELERSLKRAQAERIAAIDALDLVPVGERK